MRILGALLFLLLPELLHASSNEGTVICQDPGSEIVYGNGMFNSRDEALQSLQALRKLGFGRSLESNSSRLRYTLAYNSSERITQQLLQVFRQKLNDSLVDFWLWTTGNLIPPDWFKEREKYIVAADLLLQSALPLDNDLEDHVLKYQDSITSGWKVMLVSHSQGNFYANESYRRLRAASKFNWALKAPFGNVQVATPTDSVASHGPYFTFSQDLVIQSLRKFQSALAPNMDGGAGVPPEGDYNGHSFIKAYLKGLESRSRLLTAVNQVGESLVSMGGEAFTVTFETEATSKIELRIQVPDSRTHIAPAGLIVSLGSNAEYGDNQARIKRYSYLGPCSDLKEGDYEIALNTFGASLRESKGKLQFAYGGRIETLTLLPKIIQGVKSYYQPQFSFHVSKAAGVIRLRMGK